MGKPLLIRSKCDVVDQDGKKTAVQISIEDWEALKAYVKELEDQLGIKNPPRGSSKKTVPADDQTQPNH